MGVGVSCNVGSGASCNKMDCAMIVEECSTKAAPRRPNSFWVNCSGQDPEGDAVPSAGSREQEPDPSELIATQDLQVKLVCDRFTIRRNAGSGGAEWQRSYMLGRELGAGQTATVFEAFAAVKGAEGSSPGQQVQRPPGSNSSDGGRSGRRVALKRFYASGTSMFQSELRALTAVGVHPHIIRLLETFEGGSHDDVLVLEHCDGSDVYELYAANNGCPMLEAFVAQLMRQLLLALEHLVSRSVEHRDVKPENLLLFGGAVARRVPCLKLADFGWAVVVPQGSKPPSVPPEGVGSLWYAPPELNPPVEGTIFETTALGKSDMWSVGVITYLLLIGHSPFNYALRIKDAAAKEAEVIRLAALGQINTGARAWPGMSEEARAFVLALLQPDADRRLSPTEALRHPWMEMQLKADVGSPTEVPARVPADERSTRWRGLDGLQRLCWLAFARAVAEPELVEVTTISAFLAEECNERSLYLERLAMELAAAAGPAWFLPDASWADVLQLAFSYLDLDQDGLLSASDLVQHLVGEDARESAECWVFKWLRRQDAAARYSTRGLSLADFRHALSTVDPVVPGAVVAVSSKAHPPSDVSDGKVTELTDSVMEKRIQAIDGVCQKFLDEEFDENGYGL